MRGDVFVLGDGHENRIIRRLETFKASPVRAALTAPWAIYSTANDNFTCIRPSRPGQPTNTSNRRRIWLLCYYESWRAG